MGREQSSQFGQGHQNQGGKPEQSRETDEQKRQREERERQQRPNKGGAADEEEN